MAIIFVILLPLLTIVFLPLKTRHRKTFYASVSSLSLINIWTLITLPIHFQKINLGFNLVFLVDRYSWFFAVLVNICWLLTIIYSYSFVKYGFQRHVKQFHCYLSIVLTTVLATVFSGNLGTLFVFYVLNIPMIYPLITLRHIEKAYEAGSYYLKMTLLPAFFILLPAILMIYKIEGHFDFGDKLPNAWIDKPYLASILLIMFIIGMSKNSVMPFHTWLPKTMLAPAPVSALIHSVAAVQTGSIALIKIAVYVYGLDFLRELTRHFFQAGCLTYLCGITAIYAACKALQSNDIKVRFSYSTVSQLSYIITAILISTPAAILGAMLHILTHSIAKLCLFFIAGFYNSVYGTVNAVEVARIAPRTKLIVLCVALSGASIAGFPFLAGYLSKDLMLLEELHAGNYAAALFLLAGSIINVFYIWPLVRAGFMNKPDPTIVIKPIPRAMALAISLCMVLLVSLSFYTYYIVRAFESF